MKTISIGIDVGRGWIIWIHWHAIVMPFLPSDLTANAKKPENVVNRQTDGQSIIPISMNKLRLSHLDTSACQNVDFFFQEICPQYQNLSSWTVWRTDRQTDGGTNEWLEGIPMSPWTWFMTEMQSKLKNYKCKKKTLLVTVWSWYKTYNV